MYMQVFLFRFLTHVHRTEHLRANCSPSSNHPLENFRTSSPREQRCAAAGVPLYPRADWPPRSAIPRWRSDTARDGRCVLARGREKCGILFPVRLLGPYDYVYGIREGGDHSRRVPLPTPSRPSQHRTVSPCSTSEYGPQAKSYCRVLRLLRRFFSLVRTHIRHCGFFHSSDHDHISKLFQSINRL